MKNKTLTIILSVVFIICIGANIYQYMTTSSLQESLSVLTNTRNELASDIENKTVELKNITDEIEATNTTISELTAKVDSLKKEIKAVAEPVEETTVDDGINSTHTDIELGDDEYKGDEETDLANYNFGETKEDQEILDEVDRILKERHPEWYTDTGNTNNTGNTENKAPGYVSVDAPVDNGVIPEYTVGESGSEGLSDNVTIY